MDAAPTRRSDTGDRRAHNTVSGIFRARGDTGGNGAIDRTVAKATFRPNVLITHRSSPFSPADRFEEMVTMRSPVRTLAPRRRSRRAAILAVGLVAVVLLVPAGGAGAGPVAEPPGETDGLIRLPTVAGVETTAVAVTGADGRPLASSRVAVDALPGPTAFEAAPGFGATVAVPTGEMVGVEWTGAPTGAVQVRARTATGWTGWSDLAANPDEGPDATSPEARTAGHSAVGPIWTGSGTTSVQVQVTSGRLTDLRVQVLRTSGPQAPEVQADGGRSGQSTAAAGERAAPAISPRSAWGAGPWQYGNAGCGSGPQTSPLRHAIVHHTAGSNTYSPSEVDDVLRGIYSFHIGTQGWCDMAYNFLVDRFGGVWEGRTDSLEGPVIGGHAKGFNTGSVGVSLMGDFEAGGLPEPAFAAARRVLAWRMGDAGLDPNGSLAVVSGGSTRYPAGRTVLMPRLNAHQTTSLTACPGGNTMRRLAELRFLVAWDVLNAGPFHPLPGYRPASGVPALEVLDRWGGVHPAGRGATVPGSGSWPGWDIARDIAGVAGEGYVVDGWGGLHPYGVAPPATPSAYWHGRDLAIGVSRGPTTGSGYTLDAFGGVHPFGRANRGVDPAPRWFGWRIARDIVSTAEGNGGYVLDGFGGIHAFGNAPPIQARSYWPGWDIARAITLRPDGPGGYVLDAFGGLHPFGGAPWLPSGHYDTNTSHKDLVLLPGLRGYVADSDGHVFPFNGAPAVASSLTWPGRNLTAGLVATA
jgi:hypothetical protein